MNADLKSVLNELKKYVFPAKEPTLFAVGCRGYYENPASDLLAFFLKPDGEHKLKDLFLSTFLECMKEDHRQLDMSYVSIQREVETDDCKRIDLQILGSDWCLLIENKIYHWEANPFESYEAHAKMLGKKRNLFSILSPSGCCKKEGKGEDWRGVSYLAYCKALRERMSAIFFASPFSKWHLFAREFILHMENELYHPPMTTEQANFVEKHATAFIQAQKLLQQYPDYLRSVLNEALAKRLPYSIEVAANWAILIRSPGRWGNAYIAFRPPTMDEVKFHISIYPDEGELKRGRPV